MPARHVIAFMKRRKTFQYIVGLGILALLPVVLCAHQISLIRGEAVVYRDKIDLKLNVLPEDVLLSAGSLNIVSGRVAKADILRATEMHPAFLLDGLVILDEDGRRLTGKILKVELPALTDEGILADDLLATTIVYRVEYPLAKIPARLSFQHHFNTKAFAMPVIAQLTVTREGLTYGTMMQVPEGENAETVTFDWTETPGSPTTASGGKADDQACLVRCERHVPLYPKRRSPPRNPYASVHAGSLATGRAPTPTSSNPSNKSSRSERSQNSSPSRTN